MDLFASPSWDADDACEDLNTKLFGNTSYSVAVSNKKSRKADRKYAKAEKNRSPTIISPRSQNIAKVKQEILSELKGKFAKKRKLDDASFVKPLKQLPQVPKKKTVRFKVDAEDNDLVDVEMISPEKKSKKNKMKKKKKNELDTAMGVKATDVEKSSKYTLLMSKLTKKKAKLDKKKDITLKSDQIQSTEDKREKNGIRAIETTSSQCQDNVVLKKAQKATTKSGKLNSEDPTLDSVKLSKKQLKKSKHTFFSAEGVPATSGAAVSPSSKTTCSPVEDNVSKTSVVQTSNHVLKPPRQQCKPNAAEAKVLNRRNPGTLRERMMRKLQASRFRYLNEQMYCSKGNEALEYFKTDPEAFQAYHQGYRAQVAQWPLNPIDKIIIALKKKPSSLVIADFGCGDAKLARSLPNKVHSFDLVSVSPEVTACDMSRTPLGKASVDVAVFCLSLMGTNLADYLKEANRVLKPGGILKIAEVESRFENIDAFIRSLQNYGFSLTNKDLTNNLFYFIDMKKADNIKKNKSTKLPDVTLKPCLYKKR